jgi:hypothetical protein
MGAAADSPARLNRKSLDLVATIWYTRWLIEGRKRG